MAASSRPCTRSPATSHAEVFGETSNHPGDLAPLQPRFGALQLLAFPKLKSPLKGKRFQTIDETQEKMGQLMAIPTKDFAESFEQWKRLWENCVRSQVVFVLCAMFLVPCIFFNKCLYFSYHMARYYLDRPHILFWALTSEDKVEATYIFSMNSLSLGL